MDTNEHGTTPFDEAWQYIRDNGGGAAEALAKLYLAFWNHYDHPYTLPECIPPLDSERRRIAKGMIDYYLENGTDDTTRRHAKDILAKYPKFKRKKTKSDPVTDAKKAIADFLWKLKRIARNLGTAVANHDFDDAHAETGRLADTIEHYEKTHPDHAV